MSPGHLQNVERLHPVETECGGNYNLAALTFCALVSSSSVLALFHTVSQFSGGLLEFLSTLSTFLLTSWKARHHNLIPRSIDFHIQGLLHDLIRLTPCVLRSDVSATADRLPICPMFCPHGRTKRNPAQVHALGITRREISRT